MIQTEKDEKFVLPIKDDLSGHCRLELSASADSEHTAEVLFWWNRALTAADVWVSDLAPHFKN